jgi:hypothetical protein
VLLLAALAGTVGLAGHSRGQVTMSQWLTATSGNWTDATRWSTNPFYPTNGNGNPLYRAEILATGSNYTITLNSNVALDSLLLSSTNATISHTAGTLTLGGSATLTAGTFNLGGGTIAGGTINNTANRLTFTNNTTSTFNNVAVTGGIGLGGFGTRLRVYTGLTATGSINVNGVSSALMMMNSQTFTGGTINVNGGSAQSNNNLSIEGTSAFTLAAGATIVGQYARLGSQLVTTGANSFLNQGAVTANNPGIIDIVASSFTNAGLAQSSNGGTLTISSANWTSSGTIRANTGSTVNLNGNWSNTGSIEANAGVINLGGGFSTAGLAVTNTAGTINITGVGNNTGRTLAFNGGTGSWNLFGGTISGGSLSFADGQQLNFAEGATGTLNNVSVLGDWTISTGFLQMRLGGTFGSTGTVRLSSAQGGIVEMLAGSTLAANTELSGRTKSFRLFGASSVASGTTLSAMSGEHNLGGGGGGSSALTNNGTLLSSGAGTQLEIRPDTIINNGLIRVENGAQLFLGFATSGFATVLDNNGTIQVDHGTLLLSGNLRTSDLGTIERTGGRIAAYANLDNTGSTFNLSAHGGTWSARGLQITGGTVIVGAGGTLEFDNSVGQGNLGLTDVNIQGDLALAGATGAGSTSTTYLNLSGNVGMTGTFSFTDQYARGQIIGTTTLSGGTIAFDSTSGQENYFLYDPNSVLITASDMLIRGGRGNIGAHTAINNGTIRADVVGQKLGFDGRFTTINGVAETIGGDLTLAGLERLHVNGDIRVNGGSLLMSSYGGTVTFGDDFVFSRSGGTVSIDGVIDNTGKTLNLDGSTGSWNLFSGNGNARLRGGTLNLSDGAQFVRGNYENVTVNGDFTIGYEDTVIIFGSMNLNGEITMTDRSSLRIFPDLGGVGPVSFNGGTIRMTPSSTGRAEIWLGSGPVTFGPDTTIIGGGRLDGNYDVSIGKSDAYNSVLINQGTIICEADKAMYLRPNLLINQGLLRAEAGSYFSIANDLGNRWENHGQIIADGGVVRISGVGATSTFGDIRSINGGRIVLAGAIDNSGQTLTLSDATGDYYLSEARIKGGHVSRSGSAELKFDAGTNIVDGVTFDQDLNIRNTSAGLNVRNSLVVNGIVNMIGLSRLAFEADCTFEGTIVFDGDAQGSASLFAGDYGLAGTLTLGPGSTVRGGNGRIFTSLSSTIINRGTISADVAGEKIQIYLQRFLNEGIMQTVNGGILEFIPPPSLDPTRGTMVNSGLLAFVGATSMYGDLVQSEIGTTSLTITGTSLESFALLSISGSVLFSGNVSVLLADDAILGQGDMVRLVSALSLTWSADSSLILPELASGLSWDRQHINSGVLKIIPSPSVLGFSIAGLLLAARRRTR